MRRTGGVFLLGLAVVAAGLLVASLRVNPYFYFAAYVITSVNKDQRHEDLTTLENEMGVERKRVEQRRDADVEARAQKLETDLAELEAEGAKSDVRRKVKEGGEREMRQIRDKAQREIHIPVGNLLRGLGALNAKPVRYSVAHRE